MITPRERFIAALERRPLVGRVPHFELDFYLTMEAFGRLHSSQRSYGQWAQMCETERTLHRRDLADLYVRVAEKYEHSGIMFHTPYGWEEEDVMRSIDHIREFSGDRYLIVQHGDPTYSIPEGNSMMSFSTRLVDDPQGLKDEASRAVDEALVKAVRIRRWGTQDGFCMCSDYCFNDNPFLPPEMFAEFVAPYLKTLIAGYRELGFYVIKHTDGNIMPILDFLIDANPHALHSIDPQGKVDIQEVKRRVGDKVCLIGNVDCGLMQTGTDEEVTVSARYALENGMPGGGYVFSTSNCIFTGMPLARYELILQVWRQYGNYNEASNQGDE